MFIGAITTFATIQIKAYMDLCYMELIYDYTMAYFLHLK